MRPDGLINEQEVTNYAVYLSPIKSAIFEASKISRINVVHFMTELIVNVNVWNKWKGNMPVMYSDK